MAPPIINARDIRNGWGVDGAATTTGGGAGLNYLQCRWTRDDMLNMGFDGAAGATLAAGMVTSAFFDPNPKIVGITDAYVDGNNWTSQQTPLLTAVARKTQNGNKLFQIIENANEIGNTSVGNGHHVISDTSATVKLEATSGGNGVDGCGNLPTMQAAFDWSVGLNNFRNANAAAFSGVKIASCTILDGNLHTSPSVSGRNGDFPAAAPNGINVNGIADYGAFHFYVNPLAGATSPSGPGVGNQINLAQSYLGFKNGFSGGAGTFQLLLTETGGNEHDNFAIDGVGCAWIAILAMLDFFALGGKLYLHYNMIGNTPASTEGSFGLFGTRSAGSIWTTSVPPNNPRPRANAMRNLSTLMSLSNTYSNASNITTAELTGNITPAYTGANLTITGIDSVGPAGSTMVCPKSDGSTMIAVWRQPAIETNVTPPAQTTPIVTPNTVTVNFGSSQTYRIWDVFGGTGGNTTVVTNAPTLVAGQAGTGTSVTFPLFTSAFIELLPTNVTSAPVTPATPTLGPTTATSQVINWTTVTSGTAAVANYAAQFSTNNTTWITPTGGATLGQASTFAFVGLTPATNYFFRTQATNAVGGPISSASIAATTAGSSGGGTPVLVQTNSFRSDQPTATPTITLGLVNQPLSTNSIFVMFNGFAGSGTNSNAIVAPVGSTVLSGPNYDGGSEVTWAWQVPYTSTNQWTFSNFDNLNNAGWKILEVNGYSTFDTSHGVVPSETATAVGVNLVSPTFSNVLRLTLLSLQNPATIGAGSAGVAVVKADPLTFHQGVLLTETTAATSPISLGLTGGIAGDTSSYLNLQLYGGVVPNQVTGVTISAVSANSFSISWTGQTVATSYTVNISSTSATAGFSLLSTVPSTTTNAQATNLAANTSYWVQVAANNAVGQGAFSAAATTTTTSVSTLLIIQSAQGQDAAVASSVTATLANPTKVGNYVLVFVTLQNVVGNAALPVPAGFTQVAKQAGVGGSIQLLYQQTVTIPSATYTFAGYTDYASIDVIEVQGVTPASTIATTGAATFIDNVSITAAVTIPGTTPNINLLCVSMDIGPDAWGTPPANTSLLLGGLSTPLNTIMFHQGSVFTLASAGAAGNRVIPFTSQFGQGAVPIFTEVNLFGAAAAPTPPGGTSLVFSSATSSSITLTYAAASGTVTAYQVVIAPTINMLNGQTSSQPTSPFTISTRPSAIGGGPLTPLTTYFFTITPFNGSTPGPTSAVLSATTTTGTVNRPVLVGGKPLNTGGKPIVA